LKLAYLIANHHTMTDAEVKAAVAKLSFHEKDLIFPCKVCGADEGQECKEVPLKRRTKKKFKWKPGMIHIGRRIHRLLKGVR
jgi:hypothetical protein